MLLDHSNGGTQPMTVTIGYNAEGRRASYTVSKPNQPAFGERFQYRNGEIGQVTVSSGVVVMNVDTYVYANDDPVDLTAVGGYFLSFKALWRHAMVFADAAAHVTYKVAQAAWNAVAGDDTHTICCTRYPLPIKMLAGVDLTLTMLPGGDAAKILEIGARTAAKAAGRHAVERGAIDLVHWVLKHAPGDLGNVGDDAIRRWPRPRAKANATMRQTQTCQRRRGLL